MPILDDDVKGQLRERFAERLVGPVDLTLHTRPGSGRLILPSGLGCATCDDARELAEELAAIDPAHIRLEVIDVSATADGSMAVPTLSVAPAGLPARMSWQGLTAGFEFATVIDAIERASSGDLGLSKESIQAIGRLTEPVEVMVFATPT